MNKSNRFLFIFTGKLGESSKECEDLLEAIKEVTRKSRYYITQRITRTECTKLTETQS